MDAQPTIRPSSSISAIPWAIFLASSWTWCIGMYLPVLLVRDYGLWGWIVFAIPNVIGAVAMGWTVKDRAHSRRQVRVHHNAMAIFSIVTIAFQCYYGAWYLSWYFGGKGGGEFWPTMLMPAFVMGFALAVSGERDPRMRLSMAAVAYVVSLTCLALFVYANGSKIPIHAQTPQPGLLPLAVACFFGFALCPYLDLTFHDARQHTGIAEGRVAFSVGFGVLFLVMIVFSLLYARWMMLGLVISLHLLMQLAFTSAAHLGELLTTQRRALWIGTVAACMVAHVLGHYAAVSYRGELFYRWFMSFYGLLFPAYVWLCMLPTWNNPQAPTRRMWIVLATAVLVAAPMFWAAFVGGRMIWALPGVAVVLFARWPVSSRRGGGLAA